MSSVSSLLELGDRYVALGLPAAARGAFARALEASPPGDAAAARRLAELALATGDGYSARAFAKEVVKREPGPGSRILLGRAQLAAGEFAGATFSFATALGAGRISPLMRAKAHLGRSMSARAESDHAGVIANVMAGIDAFHEFAGHPDCDPATVDRELSVVDELYARAVDGDRKDDVGERITELSESRPEAPTALFRGIFLAVCQSHGEDIADQAIERALTDELQRRPESRVTRLRLIERQLRRRYRDRDARRDAIEELELMVGKMVESSPPSTENVELARVYFMLAAAYEDDPSALAKAEELYRKGLELRPGNAMAANRLALLRLARGDNEAALTEIERALRIDASPGLAWRNAARVLDASSPGPGLPEVVSRLLDAATPGAGAAASGVAPRLVTATAEVARGDILAGMYARGHRLKNVLGIIGSRTRSARKLAGEGELSQRLADLEREVTALYNEWSHYLRSMQTTGPVVEILPTAALVTEVVEAARAKTQVPIDINIAGALPDLRGDRTLLREALLNIVSNAAEACADDSQPGDTDSASAREPGQDRVQVNARTVSRGNTPLIEIEVVDTGSGIPRADLSRVFAPGFTTKETGSGVGLAIAERVVTAHHGRILIDSEEGRGTTVTVVLPTDLGGFTMLAAFPGPGADA